MDLTFCYGKMNTAKTTVLLVDCFRLKNRVFVLKSILDDRFDKELIVSRVGISRKCDMLFNSTTDFSKLNISQDYIYIDEGQFLTKTQVEQLRDYTYSHNKHIVAFGLLNNSKSIMFEGSKRLVELSDRLKCLDNEDSKCTICLTDKPLIDGKFGYSRSKLQLITDDEEITIGDSQYHPICWTCFRQFESE